MTPEVAREILARRSLSQTAAARLCGVTVPRFLRMLAGQEDISPPAERLLVLIDRSADALEILRAIPADRS